jgi:hypothetical protein
LKIAVLIFRRRQPKSTHEANPTQPTLIVEEMTGP